MSEDYLFKTVVAPILTACASFGAAVMAFRPRLKRAENDIKKLDDEKLDEKVFIEVRSHIDTKFEAQGNWLESVDDKLGIIAKNMERRNGSRDDD